MKYTIYNTTTGEISRVVICNDPQEQLGNGESYIDGDYSDIEYQIVNGEAVTKPTPVFDAESAAVAIRIKRNKLLLASDYTQLPDSKVNKDVWASYREELRNLTQQSGFPQNIVWPVAPN